MAKAISLSSGIPELEIWVNYLTSNLRITTVEWTIPSNNISVHAKIFNGGTLFYERTLIGPISDVESIAGNHAMIPVLIQGETHYVFPSYLTYQFNIEIRGIG